MKKLFNKVFDKTQKMSPLFVMLVALSVASMLISNVIACKVFPLFGWSVAGYALTLPVAVIVFPVTYILSDLFSECYGYKWSRITCYIAFFMNILMVIFFQLAICIPGNDASTAEAFKTILGATPLTLVAGLVAYVVGDLGNDLVFKRMKQKASSNDNTLKFIARAVLSSLLGEILDSSIFIPILYVNLLVSFNVPYPPFYAILLMILIQAGVKTLYELCISPLTALIAKKVHKYEEEFKRA